MGLKPDLLSLLPSERAMVMKERVYRPPNGWDEVSTLGIISWLVVGAIAGYIAGYLVKGDEGLGVIGHILLGIFGGLIGGLVAGLITGGNDYITGINITTIIVAVIGAVVAVVGYGMITGRRSGRGPI
jgi:uncharacterized membrane protein YeaQ/YmgE (transglycosylase-associated protein family)